MEPAESGVYTWDILDNRVFGDRAVAALFGFDGGLAESGLPLQIYLDRIHQDDRPKIARAIRDALTTSVTFQESYRVSREDGSMVEVVAFGRCFRHQGEPRFWSGIIYPLARTSDSSDELLGHLLASHDLAESAGELLAAQKIVEAIGHVYGQRGQATGPTGLKVKISTPNKPRNS